VIKTLAQQYENEQFIHVLPFGETPSTHHVRGSNECHIGVVSDRIENRCIIIAALDNLTKGSSGQAIQNANLMLGLDENAGLKLVPVFP
jgi:N-acetyl-gamma-glutamyl-phosphate reductase